MNHVSSIKRFALAGLTALTLVAAVAPLSVSANDADIIRRGSCTNRSDWKLKLSPEDGRIEVEFEVDSPRVGQTWSVRMKQNGTLFWTGTRTTLSPSGSFEVRFLRRNTSGTDTFRGRAQNLTTGEVCIGLASI